MVNFAAAIAYKITPADLGEAVTEMVEWLDLYASDRALIILTLVSLVLLAVLNRDDRRRLFWPMVVGALVVLNPVLYLLVLQRGRYWRFLWLLPNTVIIALACVRLMELVRFKAAQLPVFIALCVLVMFTGSFTYDHWSFSKKVNPEGVSEATCAVADYLLEQEESPLCLVEKSLFMDIRQYDGDIRLVYGRNADGYITGATKTTRRIAAAMAKKETPYKKVLKYAVDRECTYLVVDKNDPIPRYLRKRYKYEKVRTICDYIIYRRDFEANPAA